MKLPKNVYCITWQILLYIFQVNFVLIFEMLFSIEFKFHGVLKEICIGIEDKFINVYMYAFMFS